MNPCKCGCGQMTPKNWVRGHHWSSRRFNHHEIEDRGHSSPCWIFKGCKNHNGYGRITVGSSKVNAHRVYYEHYIGPIPDGLQIDHLCRVRECVNPAHLEPVTPKENVARALSFQVPRRRTWTVAMDAALRAGKDRGLSAEAIAKALGQSKTSVDVRASLLGIKCNWKARAERTK